MDNKEKNKKEFLEFAEKQRNAVRQGTDYMMFFGVLAIALLIIFFFASRG